MSHSPLKLSACLCRSNSHQRESRIHFLQAHEMVGRVGEMDMGSRWSVIHPVLPSLTLDFRIGSYSEYWRLIIRKHNSYPFFPLEGRIEHDDLSSHDSWLGALHNQVLQHRSLLFDSSWKKKILEIRSPSIHYNHPLASFSIQSQKFKNYISEISLPLEFCMWPRSLTSGFNLEAAT